MKASSDRAKDWQQARERLARTTEALGEARLSPERARAILEERARLLARVPPQAPLAAEVVEVLTFALGSERYAVETRHVRETLRFKDCTPLPGTPDSLLGVINLRGQVLALFDLAACLGLSKSAAGDDAWIIVLGDDRPEFGILAEAVFEVTRLQQDQVLEPPASMERGVREFVRGVTAAALIVIDTGVLLTDPRFFLDQREDHDFASPEVRT